MELTQAKWMLICDADFVPNTGIYEYLLGELPAWGVSYVV